MLILHKIVIQFFSESDKKYLQSTVGEIIEALEIKKTTLSQKNFVTNTGK